VERSVGRFTVVAVCDSRPVVVVAGICEVTYSGVVYFPKGSLFWGCDGRWRTKTENR
jgi:hypothetical protein